MIRSRSFASAVAILYPPWGLTSATQIAVPCPCPHTTVDVSFEGVEFGKPITGGCRRCKKRVPVAATVLLTAQAASKLNGPWHVSADGVWTRPTDGGEAQVVR